MAKQVTKKKWTEPELIVLIRSNPEEAVLTGCKSDTVGVARSSEAGKCKYWPGTCMHCDAQAMS
jgi:hypothetical protein